MIEAKIGILILIKGLGLGGAERMIVDAIAYLDRDQFDYEVAYLLPWKDFLVKDIRKQGLPVHCLGMKSAVGLPRAFARLRRLQRERNYRLIHAHLPVAGFLARAVGKACGIPVVYTEHNLQERYHPLTAVMNRATFGWNSTVVAVSKEVAASIARAGLDRKVPVVIVPNGVPLESIRAEARDAAGLRREFGIPEGAQVVGTVAVFRTQKRLQDWIEVARRVLAARPGTYFLLAGHGPQEASLRVRVRELGLSDRIVMPGFRPDGRRVMGLFDIFLMTSEFEGLPIALLEAMALEKPVVATSVGGIPEVVTNGEEGFLAPVGDTASLAEAVLRLLGDETLGREMGRKGMEKVGREFDVARNVRRVEALYHDLLEEKHHA